MYKRVLIKISGEQLSGKFESGIDPELVGWLAREIKEISESGTQVVLMVGGGNFVRGAQVVGHGVKRVTGDHMGMLGTVINALALTDIFEAQGVRTRCLSNIFADQVAEKFVHRLANKHLEKGRVVIAAGGTGRPYLTTDTAAVVIALELDCEVVLKATKFDGVYDKDPADNPDAKKFETLTMQQAIENRDIKVMDKAALGLAMEHKVKVVVFDLTKKGNIKNASAGKPAGTLIS
ncbi:UMP kinase [Candidatus Saccharibacteria bacterium RIFCSPHIGHO2_12_FULL_41_12]|nr:MAG: UMP kinase [Candidatus Saccharibacteria bacterium RIFCSPHIGHO2_12_FULL_41_12]